MSTASMRRASRDSNQTGKRTARAALRIGLKSATDISQNLRHCQEETGVTKNYTAQRCWRSNGLAPMPRVMRNYWDNWLVYASEWVWHRQSWLRDARCPWLACQCGVARGGGESTGGQATSGTRS